MVQQCLTMVILKCIERQRLFFKIYGPKPDKRGLLAIQVKSEIFTYKKDLSVVNNYRKFEEIIFTNNKAMSVKIRKDDAF